jgi:MSHA pilin protein MshD
MLALAEEMMEEIMLKSYAVGAGAIVACDRSQADDIADYKGYSHTTCTIDGTAIPSLGDYTTAVTVTPAAIGAIPAASASLVTVTVTHGGQSVSLSAWRADYANGLPN